MAQRGKIIIISGPSGSGKTTLHKLLLKSRKFKNILVKSISFTTRPRRKGEVNGRDYFFVSLKQFLYKKRAGHFLESERVFDNYYGTPKRHVRDLLKSGKNVLLCIDVMGSRKVMCHFSSTIGIFIKTPSLAALKKRLSMRGTEDSQIVQKRLNRVKKELQQAKNYHHVIINDNLKTAYRKLEQCVLRVFAA